MIKFKNVLLVSFILLFCSTIFSQGFEKLSSEKVDQNKVNLAKGFVNRYFNAGREGRIYEFQNDATAKPEIRIVIDEADKVAGLWYKPWEDELK